MARRHRILAKATKFAVKAAVAPVIITGWGCILLVIYWQMATGKAGEKPQGGHDSTQKRR